MPHLSQDLTVLLLRELEALQREIELYPNDASLWAALPGVPNVGGTLVLHLVGNLRYFIGTTIGPGHYVRDREAEFARRDISQSELLALVATTRREIEDGMAQLTESSLDATFPIAVGGRSMSTRVFLLHLLSHLGYHLGQIDYHRRVSTGNATSANALPLSALGTAAP